MPYKFIKSMRGTFADILTMGQFYGYLRDSASLNLQIPSCTGTLNNHSLNSHFLISHHFDPTIITFATSLTGLSTTITIT